MIGTGHRGVARRPSLTCGAVLLLAGLLVGCGESPGEARTAPDPAGAGAESGEREPSRRDMLGGAIARGPAWAPGGALFTSEQATRGEELFLVYCTACHGLANMTSEQLRENWTGRTVGDFYEYVRYAMPYDAPGRLSAEENADLVAFLFRENGLPAGPEPLTTDIEELQHLRLVHPDSAGSGPGTGSGSD